MPAMMNYIHTDASGVYFLVEWLPLGTPLGLFMGLTLTGVLCAAERVMTRSLDQYSLELYQWQEDQLLVRQEQNDEFSATAISGGDLSAQRRRRSNSNSSKLQQAGVSSVSLQSSAGGSSNAGGGGNLVHGSTSLIRLQYLQQRQMRRLLAKKTLLYFGVNTLRLGYMLLAMSLHLGLLLVIAFSLTGTQLLLDCLNLKRSQHGSLQGYDPLGSSMELDHDFTHSPLRRVDRSDEDELDEEEEDIDTDSGEIRRHSATGAAGRCQQQSKARQLEPGARSQQQRYNQSTASMALHLSRSHDCV